MLPTLPARDCPHPMLAPLIQQPRVVRAALLERAGCQFSWTHGAFQIWRFLICFLYLFRMEFFNKINQKDNFRFIRIFWLNLIYSKLNLFFKFIWPYPVKVVNFLGAIWFDFNSFISKFDLYFKLLNFCEKFLNANSNIINL